MVIKIEDMYNRLDTLPACDIRTDRQTDRQTDGHLATAESVLFLICRAVKIRRAAGTCHSALTKRCAFRRRAKVAVDSVDRRSSAGKLFQVSGPETATFLRPMAKIY